jgi:hypothetical protein
VRLGSQHRAATPISRRLVDGSLSCGLRSVLVDQSGAHAAFPKADGQVWRGIICPAAPPGNVFVDLKPWDNYAPLFLILVIGIFDQREKGCVAFDQAVAQLIGCQLTIWLTKRWMVKVREGLRGGLGIVRLAPFN